MKLTPRLQKIAQLIDKGSKVIDVGTDHGYIPLYLISNNLIEKCIAADINIGPLNTAKNTFRKHGIEHMVEFRLGSGLSVLKENDDIDTAIIAGMGGETIISILEEAPNFSKGLTLIIQPMTEVLTVREYLDKNGWEIIDEDIAKEGQRFYEIIKAKKKRNTSFLSYKQYRFGPILLAKKEDSFVYYLKKQYEKNRKIINYLDQGSNTSDIKENLIADNNLIKEVLKEIEGTGNNPKN
ncbi:tRNA (adenine22-N1)-methyltransferase [Anaerobranca californiensis DSM 14826]|jgi:tRNA (adenine22-N1)-methyltransferase|uniref:tRNA (Adenine22-N1)-methyltransferase n=1 Tax=Anaerobranca californiensis DSM 14826 TaxID=1120989 RepID=A0A1M6KZP8_9FIRM|nr:class I SAM-dependent methyltransferase [Anaerobranca californiensis]SHJ64441.1 tRNA (adenine22-N1)-methyltransferase [Anaerobranca californiensis DSM 14826]